MNVNVRYALSIFAQQFTGHTKSTNKYTFGKLHKISSKSVVYRFKYLRFDLISFPTELKSILYLCVYKAIVYDVLWLAMIIDLKGGSECVCVFVCVKT